MRGWISNVQIVVICLGVAVSLTGCGGMNSRPDASTTQPGAIANPALPEFSSGFNLPAPSEIQARTASALKFVEMRDGSDFMTGLSQHVNPSAPKAVFSPDWADGSSPFSGVAYAIYQFSLSGWGGQLQVHTQWTNKPKDFGLLWFGLSNWERDRWDWYSGAPGGNPALKTAAMDLYKRAHSGETYVAVVLLGQGGSSLLDQVWFDGMSQRGDWWMQGRDAQHTSCSRYYGPEGPALLWQTQIADPTDSYDEKSVIYHANRIQAVYDSAGVAYVLVDRSIVYVMNTLFTFTPGGSLVLRKSVNSDALPLHTYCPAMDNDGTMFWHMLWLYHWTADGDRTWEFATHWVHSPPVIGPEGNVYIVDATPSSGNPGRYLHAVSGQGSQLWEYYFGDGPDYLPPWSESTTAPAVAPDGTVYVGCWDDQFYAFSPAGDVLWTYTAAAPITKGSSIAKDGAVYFATDEPALYALSPAGSLLWKTLLQGQANNLASIGPDGSLYVNCADGKLYAFSPGGAARWNYNTGYSHPAPTLDANGTAYVGSDNANLYAINPDGTLKWTFTADSGIEAQPTISENGSLCFMSIGGWFYCVGPGEV